jgi:DNA-binding CsgD family transcriptional regulator
MGMRRSTRTIAPETLGNERAILVVSPSGRIQFMTPRAAKLLKGISFPRGKRLPKTLAGWLGEIVSSGWTAPFVLDHAGTQLSFQVIYREPKSVCILLEQKAQAAASNDMRGRLTQRQIEVLSWVARGKTNGEVAKILSLKPKTIGKYLERIFPKLGVENRTAAASFVLGTNRAL